MPRHTFSLRPFAIGQFAVTNAEYACFMAAGGYEDERWWETEGARAWRSGEGTAEGSKRKQSLVVATSSRSTSGACWQTWIERGQRYDEASASAGRAGWRWTRRPSRRP